MDPVVFTMTCAYCNTFIRMSTMPKPNDVLICKYCCGLFVVCVTKMTMEELTDEARASVEAAIQELRRQNWVN